MRKEHSKLLKQQLLTETIYRCGYCLKNIEHEKFEIAHINPYVAGGDESYENLIILCSGTEKEKKSGCHYEWDFGREIIPLIKKENDGKSLTTEEKKRKDFWLSLFRKLKNDWMFASGKYSRMEMDLLFDFYQSHQAPFRAIENVPKLMGYAEMPLFSIKPWLKIQEITTPDPIQPINKVTSYCIVQDIYNAQSFLLRNIIESGFVFFLKNTQTSGGGLQYPEGFLPGQVFLTITGYDFCKKFDHK